jgi:galactose mutarotase-like enzyme
VTDPRRPWVSISSGALHAQIDPLGAQLSVLRDRAERDLLWSGDPAIWAGRAPLLFPIVGALASGAYRLGSKTYHLPRHGFARVREFQIVESKASSAVFRLTADEASLQLYPFLFELEVRFAVAGATLSITTTVRNVDQTIMPASFGYHPAFRWPLPFGQARSLHVIEFAREEPAPVRRLDGSGLLTPERQPTPIVGRRLELADALFRNDVIIFDDLRSRALTYGANDGPRIRLDFPDSPYLGIWTKPQAEFICIEPWHGVADPQEFSGDFGSKPGIFKLAAGARTSMQMSMTLLP